MTTPTIGFKTNEDNFKRMGYKKGKKFTIKDLKVDENGVLLINDEETRINVCNKNYLRNEGCRDIGKHYCIGCGCPIIMESYCGEVIISQYIKIHLDNSNKDVYVCNECNEDYEEILKYNKIDYEVTDNYL